MSQHQNQQTTHPSSLSQHKHRLPFPPLPTYTPPSTIHTAYCSYHPPYPPHTLSTHPFSHLLSLPPHKPTKHASLTSNTPTHTYPHLCLSLFTLLAHFTHPLTPFLNPYTSNLPPPLNPPHKNTLSSPHTLSSHPSYTLYVPSPLTTPCMPPCQMSTSSPPTTLTRLQPTNIHQPKTSDSKNHTPPSSLVCLCS